jgi:pimeloyl-ACP methyl ester carboxylesterase
MATYVLVHGAWHDGTCWDRVAEQLRAAKHEVLTPSLLVDPHHQGMSGWSKQLLHLLRNEPRPVILVGHSMAGFAISRVAQQMPAKIERLVYLDAYLPAAGVRSFIGASSAMARYSARTTNSAVAEWWQAAARVLPRGAPIPIPPAVMLGLDMAIPEQAAIYATLRPQPQNRRDLFLRFAVPSQPVTYIACTGGAMPYFFGAGARAAEARSLMDSTWAYHAVNYGHDIQVCAPDLVVDLLGAQVPQRA